MGAASNCACEVHEKSMPMAHYDPGCDYVSLPGYAAQQHMLYQFPHVTGRTVKTKLGAHANVNRWVPDVPGAVTLRYEENPRC
jgi:hypothetical protein